MSRLVKLLAQDKRTNCAQTAVAMLTGKSIREVEAVYGKATTTFPSDHSRALDKLQVTTGAWWFYKDQPLPEVALVLVAFLQRRGGRFSSSGRVKRRGHMVLLVNGIFYDPSWPFPYTLDSFPEGMGQVVHSFLPVYR